MKSMKSTAKKVIISAAIIGMLSSNAVIFADEATQGVALYRDDDYQGVHTYLKEGNHNLSKYEFGGGNLSSIKVPYGYIVTLRTESGKHRLVLGQGEYHSLSEQGFENLAFTAEVKHYQAAEYEAELARLKKTKEFEAQAEKEINDRVQGNPVSQYWDATLNDVKVENIKNSESTNLDMIFGGSTRLTNTTNEKVTLTSQAFDFAETNTVTSATTNSIGTSVSASASFNVPVVGSLNTTVSTQYNFSDTETKSDSKTVTYKVPSQTITLNPGQTVEVRARLEKVKTSGKVKLVGNLTATERGYVSLTRLMGSGHHYSWKEYSRKPYEFHFDGKRVEGEGTYTADYGANLYIDVVNIDTKETKTFKAETTSNSDRSANTSASVINATPMNIDMTK